MDIEKFAKSPSGRLVKVGQGDAAYWAFVPTHSPLLCPGLLTWLAVSPLQTVPWENWQG